MLISKYKNKEGKVFVNFVINKNLLTLSSNDNYYLLKLDSDFLCGLDKKTSAKLSEIINLKKLKMNNDDK